eukprot:67535-Amphidinium_carterae.1
MFGEGWAFGDPLQPLLHICRGGRGTCAFNVPYVMVVHAEWFRLRNVTSLTEDWLTCRVMPSDQRQGDST